MLDLDQAISLAKKYSLNDFYGDVIYSAAIGPRDELPPSVDGHLINSDAKFVFFSDKKSFFQAGWEIFFVNEPGVEPVYLAKIFKVFPHILFPNAKVSIWVDANLTLKAISSFLLRSSAKSGVGLFRHTVRKDIKSEAKACYRLKKGNGLILLSQVSNYINSGYPMCSGLYGGYFLVRSPTKKIQEAMGLWWEEIICYTSRDQISLPYVFWKCNIDPFVIPGGFLFNNYIEWSPHSDSHISKKGPFFWRLYYSMAGRWAVLLERIKFFLVKICSE